MDNNKRNYCNEIRQKKMLETPDEKQLKIEINAMLDKIHEHLEGL